ncbi:uncharacterized protein GGS25DRAFT_461245 [Hypoxylon fragiforme]|uniref:uncharacterized protein n=1 Tax=Hypoxylon fragiforme TaxID=63214 RepID=UPI0020C69030|nr:uncharacterized protein GGS25DRAFT_461245 [Hypoxylon fragiforme]KAI2604438.1 hypothetical protein GGS25DRAFT_461245 [Hypoxylon fragiforme]
MAESHDIEYGGSGREGHVSVGSEGYFRDYTPGETAVSLGEDGQIVSSPPIPGFTEPSPHLQPRSLGGDAESSSTILPAPSHHQPLAPKLRPTLSSDRPLSPPPPPPPLTRYLRDVQTHELIALGIRVDDIQYLDPGTPPQPPTYPHVHGAARNRVATSSMSSVCLNVSEKQGSQKSTAAEGAESSPAGELPDVIKSSGSEQDEDGTTSDEHLENLHRAMKLKRRVQSETNPREVRPLKMRKRKGDSAGT